jgi:hypothetical protein
MKPLVKFEIVLATASLAFIFVAGAGGKVAVLASMQAATADLLARVAILLLFCIFGFSYIGLMLHVFIVLQVRIGNGEVPMIRFLSGHETGLTFAFWGFLGVGTLIAAVRARGHGVPNAARPIPRNPPGRYRDDDRRGAAALHAEVS